MASLIPWKRKKQREVGHTPDLENNLADRFFNDFPFSLTRSSMDSAWFPIVDVINEKRQIKVKAEIPGVEAKDIELFVDGNRLTIKGEKKYEKKEKQDHFYREDISYGAYQRTIELPAKVDENHVKAKYKKGVLNIDLRKVKEDSVIKIKVKSLLN